MKIGLELSYKEAKALKMVLDSVSGDPENSIRKYTKEISEALEEQRIEIDWEAKEIEDIFDHGKTELRFKDGTDL